MCRLPVTFGGGSTIEYAGLLLDASALKYPASTQPSYSSLSTAPGSHDLGRAVAGSAESDRARAVTAPFYEVPSAAYCVALPAPPAQAELPAQPARYFLPPSRPPRISPIGLL